MLKKISCPILAFVLCLSISSCGTRENTIEKKDEPGGIASEAETSETPNAEIDISENNKEYTEKIKPGFLCVLLRQNWVSPQGIEPDNLCAFYGFAILHLEEYPSGWDNSMERPPTEVLDGLSRFFNGVTEAQIKKSSYYIAERDVFDFRYGFGGGVGPKVTEVQYIDGKTVIFYDAVAGDEKVGDGIVIIEETNGSFQYLSNEYTEIS